MYRLLWINVVFVTVVLAQNSGSPATSVLSGPTLPARCQPAANNVFMQTGAGPTGTAYFCDTPNHWALLAGSGSGSVSPNASGGCGVVRTSNTVLTIFPGASASLSCSFSLGNDIYSFTSPATATISTGSDTAYIYISSMGALTVGTNSQIVTCSGCTSVTGITSFPVNSVPVFNWSSTSGVWASTGTDRRVNSRGRPAGNLIVRGATFTNSGGVLVAGAVTYTTSPVSCTIVSFDAWVDTGTATFDIWKKATATTLPTISNTILSSYIGVVSGENNDSTTLSAFTTTAVAAKDIFGFKLQAITGSPTQAHIEVRCQ